MSYTVRKLLESSRVELTGSDGQAIEHLWAAEVNAYAVLRFLRLETFDIDKENPDEEHAFQFLQANLGLYLQIPEHTDRFIKSLELAIVPGNSDNYVGYMLKQGLMTWDISTYDPAVHGYAHSPIPNAPIQRWVGNQIVSVENRYLSFDMHLPGYQGLPQKASFLLTSAKGRLLHTLLVANGEWVGVDTLMQQCDLDRTSIVTQITSLTYRDHKKPKTHWFPIRVESHQPHLGEFGSGSSLATHYRLALPSDLQESIIKRIETDLD